MPKVKQADMQYQEAIEQLGYYREELKKRDSRIHELETLGKTFLDASTAQAARIAELEQALRGDKTTFPIATHNGLHIYSDADAVERKIISLEAELFESRKRIAELEREYDTDAWALAKFIDYHCVEDVPDALTRDLVNKYLGK